MSTILHPKIILATLSILLGSGSLFAQVLTPTRSPEAVVFDDLDALNAADAPDIIFSNLDNTPGARYNINPLIAFPIAGRSAGDNETESWSAIAFTPREDVLAKGLATAITYVSGDRLVALGIYTDHDGTVGDLVPGGEGSTAQNPRQRRMLPADQGPSSWRGRCPHCGDALLARS